MAEKPSQPIFVPYWMLFVAAPIFVLIAVACALAGRWVFVPLWLVFAGLYVRLGFINRRRLRELQAGTDYVLRDADLSPGIPVRAMNRLGLAVAAVAAFAVAFAGLVYLLSR